VLIVITYFSGERVGGEADRPGGKKSAAAPVREDRDASLPLVIYFIAPGSGRLLKIAQPQKTKGHG
jgi:hypothetical protein